MTDLELEILLEERCKIFDLKKIAFNTLENIFLDHADEKDFLCGFDRNEIKIIFDRFEFQIKKREGASIIKTRIGLYVDNKDWLYNIEPIGYYELESDFNGMVVDDWFVIEKEKHSPANILLTNHCENNNNKNCG